MGIGIILLTIFWIIVILIIIVWLVTYSIHFFTSELISQVIKIFKNKKEDRETGDRSNQNVKNPQTQNSKNQVPVGKIIYADANNPELIYVNVGSAKGVKVGQTFDVLYSEEAEPLIDPDSGDVLGYLKQEIGQIEIIDVQTDRLSQGRAINGFERMEKDQIVRLIQKDQILIQIAELNQMSTAIENKSQPINK